MDRSIYNIGYNCTCGRKFTCAGTIKHYFAKHITCYRNRIKHTIYAIQWLRGIYHLRSHHSIYIISNFFACTKNFDRCIDLLCIFKIFRCDLGNTFCINILIINLLTICQRRQNGNLTAGIVTFHICRRIFFCISEFLGLFQDNIKIRPFFCHFRQNKVCRSI